MITTNNNTPIVMLEIYLDCIVLTLGGVFILKVQSGTGALWRRGECVRRARWQQQQQQPHTARERVAELESARSENVKVESGSALRWSRTAVCFSGGEKRLTQIPTHPEREYCLEFPPHWKYSSLNCFWVFFNVSHHPLLPAVFTLSTFEWRAWL